MVSADYLLETSFIFQVVMLVDLPRILFQVSHTTFLVKASRKFVGFV